MTTKYDHLLPPELPRNAPKRVATDLDCYPDRYEGIRHLRLIPGTLLEAAVSVAFIPSRLLGAVLTVLFTKDNDHA